MPSLGNRLVVGNIGDATIAVINPAGTTKTRLIKVGRQPEDVAISRDSRFAFVTLRGRNRVIAIDLSDGRIVTTGVTGTWSDGVAWSPVRP